LGQKSKKLKAEGLEKHKQQQREKKKAKKAKKEVLLPARHRKVSKRGGSTL